MNSEGLDVEEMRKTLKHMKKDMEEEEKSTGKDAMLPGHIFFMITDLMMMLIDALQNKIKELEDVSK